MPASRKFFSWSLLPFLVVAIGAFGIGRLSTGGSGALAQMQQDDATATATRTAELAELEQLRNLVSGSPVAVYCTPLATSTAEPSPTETVTPSVTPTPTLVPPKPAGSPVDHAGDWTITVNDITLMPNFADEVAEGIFAQVNLTVTNNINDSRSFPYEDLQLRDAQGRPFVTPLRIKTARGSGWFHPFPPSLPSPGQVIFDIAVDSTGPFILESTVDPTFRIMVELQSRG
jgi:hypothetical protein